MEVYVGSQGHQDQDLAVSSFINGAFTYLVVLSSSQTDIGPSRGFPLSTQGKKDKYTENADLYQCIELESKP